MANSIEILHLASQYLAAANLCFVAPRKDDSHSNLGWDKSLVSLITHDLNDDGLKLSLNYQYYSLDFIHPVERTVASYPLIGARHLDVLNWLVRECEFMQLGRAYEYSFHYELPYSPISDEYIFPPISEDELQRRVQIRSLAEFQFQEIGQQFESYQSSRIWPHHFDTGSLAVLTEGSIGYGLAIPDSMVDEDYFYVAGYQGHDSLDVSNLEGLKFGEWRSGTWNGATLRASAGEEAIKSFLEEVTSAYKALI